MFPAEVTFELDEHQHIRIVKLKNNTPQEERKHSNSEISVPIKTPILQQQKLVRNHCVCSLLYVT